MPTLPDFRHDPVLRDACIERCAEAGDMPCYQAEPGCRPCGECLRDVGIEPGDEFDEDAAIGRLL